MRSTAFSLLLIAPMALATGTHKPHDKSTQPVSRSTSVAVASASAAATASATQGQAQKQGQSQGQEQGQQQQASNDLSISSRDRLQAPAISAPAIYSSSVCFTGKSIGLAGPGAGISGGKSVEDPECQRREDARLLDSMGHYALALKVMCQSKYVKEVATEGDCLYKAPARSSYYFESRTDEPEYVTKEELSESLDRAFKQSQAK